MLGDDDWLDDDWIDEIWDDGVIFVAAETGLHFREGRIWPLDQLLDDEFFPDRARATAILRGKAI